MFIFSLVSKHHVALVCSPVGSHCHPGPFRSTSAVSGFERDSETLRRVPCDSRPTLKEGFSFFFFFFFLFSYISRRNSLTVIIWPRDFYLRPRVFVFLRCISTSASPHVQNPHATWGSPPFANTLLDAEGQLKVHQSSYSTAGELDFVFDSLPRSLEIS